MTSLKSNKIRCKGASPQCEVNFEPEFEQPGLIRSRYCNGCRAWLTRPMTAKQIADDLAQVRGGTHNG